MVYIFFEGEKVLGQVTEFAAALRLSIGGHADGVCRKAILKVAG
jgi:hypothetical protein